MRSFGAAAPLKELQKKFGFTVENVVAAVKTSIKKAGALAK
jgi:transketolase